MKTRKTNQPNPNEAAENQEQPVSKGRKILNTVVNVILVIALVMAAVCTYVSFVSASGNGVPSVLGLEFFSIQTDSMSPTLEPGDLAIGRVIKDKTQLRPGDVITYWTVINGERVLNTHRIEAVYDGGGFLIFGTKGDNNPSADPLTVHQSEVVGKYVSRIPGVGKALDYLQTSTGFLVVIVIPVFLFFLYHLVQFFRVLFEYQNVKNRLRYEEERGRTEDLLEERQKEQDDARARMEAEIRAQLRAELLADMQKKAAEDAAGGENNSQ
jgi:signal peptidase